MSKDHAYSTDQEHFWAGEFGTDYIDRNQGEKLLAANLEFFAHSLRAADGIGSCVELGANIGMNLKALKLLYPDIALTGVEINAAAVAELRKTVPGVRAEQCSILEWEWNEQYDLALIRGVLIHINPDMLPAVYDRLYRSSRKYVMIAEYYNPVPVAIPYRGHEDRLFKRDFAGEMLDRYPDLRLVNYGFRYHRDPVFPQDDITWFLMEKTA